MRRVFEQNGNGEWIPTYEVSDALNQVHFHDPLLDAGDMSRLSENSMFRLRDAYRLNPDGSRAR